MPVRSRSALSAKKKPAKQRRNGKLRIELDPDDALRAALETPPPDKKPAKKLPHPRRRMNGG
jgi:hypothetical protein